MLLRISDVLLEVWPHSTYYVLGAKLLTEPAGPGALRLLGTVGPVEIELLGPEMAGILVEHVGAARRAGADPVAELNILHPTDPPF